MPTTGVQFRCAARSDVGLVRANNQDSGYAGANLLVLADGMGGPAGGDIASSVAIAHLAPLDTDNHPADSLLPLLREALMDAHEELAERSTHDPDLQGLGTTCIALMRSGNKLAMVHIGDSRAYVLRDDTLTQVTTDHSFVQYLVDTGQITAEDAEHHPQRNVVLRILGDSQADVTPDETVREAIVGDRWLLCSDGLSGVVSAETIGNVLASVDDPGACAEELIRLALLAGGPDNVTCVVCDIAPVGASEPAPPQIVGAAAKDRRAPSRGGKGAAARAAALDSSGGSEDEDDDADDEAEPRRSHLAPVITLLLTAAVAAGAWLGWTWTQTQYYVIGENDFVTVHQGIPQSIASWKFSHRIEVTDIALSDLPPVHRQLLAEPVTKGSREEIDTYLDQLARSAEETRARARDEAAQSGDHAQSGDTAQSADRAQSARRGRTADSPASARTPTVSPPRSAPARTTGGGAR
ncbi:serine/threonine-protein phosphatase [Schaalia sp. 19OD2882]|uniref:PP2C family protein-serine/threonine phosphatase n=1 Tax=Schaalia sp. 19OD2882 TaxID=2794089 RepID=UPI001C1F0EC3|nr:PP2C family serine/threonine-protein phosphatase [Schaalia sp. 19OD2882]QWW19617.1 serine/threonine-protein phosphatase [Schaalia sp. 19OD2882]